MRVGQGWRTGGMRARAGLLALLLVAALPALAQDVYVSARVEPEECQVGDVVDYHAYATVLNDVTRRIDPAPPAFSGFETQGEPRLVQTDKADETIFEWVYALRAVRPGANVIAPFSVRYTGLADGQLHTETSNEVTVVVGAAPVAAPAPASPAATGEPDIRPAKPPVEVPDQLAPYRRAALLVGLGLALALLMSGVAWLFGRLARRPEAPVAEAAPEVLAPHEAALRALDALAAENLPAQGLVDVYHIRLSKIVRDYLAERYRIHASESTTSEIAMALYERVVPGDVVSLCRKVLYGCDLEKFAQHTPTREEMESLLGQARDLIRRTAAATPAAAAPKGAAAAGAQRSG